MKYLATFLFLFLVYTVTAQEIKIGSTVNSSLYTFKTPSHIFNEKKTTIKDLKAGLVFHFSPKKSKKYSFKLGPSIKKYFYRIDTKDADPRLRYTMDVKQQFNYGGIDVSILRNSQNSKHSIALNYYYERYISQSNNYKKLENYGWPYYLPNHHSFGFGYVYTPIPSISVSIDLKTSITPFGSQEDKPSYRTRRENFYVYGGGISLTYYFFNKTRNEKIQ